MLICRKCTTDLFSLLKHAALLACIALAAACQHTQEVKDEHSVALKKRNEAVGYNVQLGLAYLKQGNHPRAKKKLLNALDLDPNSAEANSALAYYMENTGDNKQAQIFYKKALKVAPNSGAQLNNYGTFLCRLGNYQESLKYFMKAVADVHYVNSAGAYENAGLCARAIPDDTLAAEYFAKAVGQDPNRTQSLVELAQIKLKQNQPAQALRYLEKYSQATLGDRQLLQLAIAAAKGMQNKDVEQFYTERLTKLADARSQNEDHV